MDYKSFMEALKGKQHKIDKNKNGKVDAHDFKLLRKEEAEELEEATVKTQKYSWGTMKTVHHGSDFSIPLHPEHHEAIAKLKDQQEHKFKDETNRHWTAKRSGDDVHFQSANDGPKTTVKHDDLKESPQRLVRSDYKVGASGRKSHKEIVFNDAQSTDDKKMKEEVEQIDELSKSTLGSYAKKASRDAVITRKIGADFERKADAARSPGMQAANTELSSRYKQKSFKRRDGLEKAVDRLTKEEVEMDEAFINGREYASHGLMHPDHAKMDIHQKANREVDFYASKTGDKMHGKVMKNDGKEVHIQAHKELGDGKLHKFKVTPNLPKTTNEDHKKDDVPFDGPYTTRPSTVKDKSGAVHGPMSRARDLARKAMQKKMKEEFNIEITEEQAADLCDTASLTEKVDINHGIKKETNGQDTMKSYKDFVTEIKMADLPSRTVKGTSYGAQYHDPEGDDHADDRKPKASKPTDATKRGRGRPSGSKSGAKQQGSEKSSNYGGIDRTTYALRLPNNNK